MYLSGFFVVHGPPLAATVPVILVGLRTVPVIFTFRVKGLTPELPSGAVFGTLSVFEKVYLPWMSFSLAPGKPKAANGAP